MRNHPALGFLVEGANSEGKRDRSVDVLVFVLRGGIAKEHRAKTAQLLVELVGLLIDRIGQSGGQAIVPVTITGKAIGRREEPGPDCHFCQARKTAARNYVARKGSARSRVNGHTETGRARDATGGNWHQARARKITAQLGGIGNVENILIYAVANAPAFVVHQEKGLVATVIQFWNVDRATQDKAKLILP